MRRILTSLTAFIIVVMASLSGAPEAAAQFRYGPSAGVNFNTLKFKQDLFTIDSQVGPAAGIVGEMMFPGIGIGIDLGLLYQLRSSKLHMGEREMWASQGYGTENMDLHMVSIPIHIKLKWHRLGGFEEKLAPMVYGGPTFSFMAGHSKIDAMNFSGGDVALECGIGAEILERWQLNAGYSFGMTYLAKAKVLTDFSCRANAWTVRLAYYF